MKKQIWIATLLYTLSIIFLLGLLYTFLSSKMEFIVASLLIIVLSLGFGYILNSYILSQKFKIDENLLHLTREILHELNIPISTIQANTALLKRTLKDNEKALKRLSRIEDSSKRLERLYAELIYSIKKEIHSVEKELFRVDELIEERVAVLRLQQRNPFLLYIEPVVIVVDRIGFEKMLDNILTNAMKYSDKLEPVTIRLKDNILTIEDRGIGMDEVELISIYERYYQSDSAVRGEGIGLALVKAYCDDEKIKIWISSQKGEGTKVSLDLVKVSC
ncbi:HAMP domain-containing histidine kinase [Sulfurovum sp. bin170]|uniref:sensor histidine kinase n=1 Tax=Sulfurovum sp. bin170 TaxID=2695268 RepID=UPI0013DF16EB|nr:HAMP domain-containing sensor histidine kinase [Sulfurovum sp. bin170]NEW59734.1 HAMP domain-containing histidine kinase [Sulfurovum sp. bin170]